MSGCTGVGQKQEKTAAASKQAKVEAEGGAESKSMAKLRKTLELASGITTPPVSLRAFFLHQFAGEYRGTCADYQAVPKRFASRRVPQDLGACE